MVRIESIEDQMNGVVTYELPNGKRVQIDAKAVRDYGAAEILRRSGYGHLLQTEHVPVMHNGQRVGTMAPDFDPTNIKSRSFLYDPRPGDFRREGEAWIAARMLGPGDLDSVPSFRRDEQ